MAPVYELFSAWARLAWWCLGRRAGLCERVVRPVGRCLVGTCGGFRPRSGHRVQICSSMTIWARKWAVLVGEHVPPTDHAALQARAGLGPPAHADEDLMRNDGAVAAFLRALIEMVSTSESAVDDGQEMEPAQLPKRMATGSLYCGGRAIVSRSTWR